MRNAAWYLFVSTLKPACDEIPHDLGLADGKIAALDGPDWSAKRDALGSTPKICRGYRQTTTIDPLNKRR